MPHIFSPLLVSISFGKTPPKMRSGIRCRQFWGLITAVVFAGVGSGFVMAAAEAPAYLVQAGQGKAEIVLGNDPARMAKFAAKELQKYVEKMTGAKLPIVAEPSGGAVAKIFVGKSSFTDKLGLKTDGLRYGAFRMAAGPEWLALLGPDKDFEPIEPWGRSKSKEETKRVNEEFDKISGDIFWNNFRMVYARYHEELGIWDFDDTGTYNAVTQFLRDQGVRWYAAGELGEVVPKVESIKLPQNLDLTIKPDFALRKINYYHDFMGVPELSLWNLRLGAYHGHDLVGMTQVGHGIKFVIMREEMKAAHPEFYALWQGKRAINAKSAGMPNLGAPGLMEKHLKYARAVFDHFDEPMLSIDMPDGFSRGIGEEDVAKGTPERGFRGSMSDYVWDYENQVARQLNKSHPDKMVSALVYGSYQLPPEKIDILSPNLALMECRKRSGFGDRDVQAYHRKLRQDWLAKLPSKKYFTWDYYNLNSPNSYGLPIYFPQLIAEDLRELKGVSSGEMIEVYNHRPDQLDKFSWDEFATEHLNIYVTARLWWDADQDLTALLDDYYSKYYGPAAAEMKAFIEYSEANWAKMKGDPEKITAALDLLTRAQKAAGQDGVYAERIGRVVEYTKPLYQLRDQLSRVRATDRDYRVLVASQSNEGRGMKSNPIDGQLDREFWPAVRVAGLTPNAPGMAGTPPTTFQILREGDNLFLGITCKEPDMKGLDVEKAEDADGKFFEGDYVTVLLETNTHSFYEIAVSPDGTVYEVDRTDEAETKWISQGQVAVFRGKDFWSVEMRIPFAGGGARTLDAMVGIDGDQPRQLYPWHFNVGRQRVRNDRVERSAFSPTGESDFRVREKLGVMWGK